MRGDDLLLLLTRNKRWIPSSLGSGLFAFWDAERTDLVSTSSGLVTSWKDTVAAINLTQDTSSARPAFSNTSFNGRPGITSDGIDDYLELASVPASFPVGAAASEIWAVVDALADNTDANARAIFGYGNSSSGGRLVQGSRDTTRKAFSTVGNGSTSNTSQNNSVLFIGRHVARLRVDPAAHQMDVDGTAGNSTAQAVNTGSARTRLASFIATSPASFGNFVFSAILVTAPLSAAQAAQMYAYFNRRL